MQISILTFVQSIWNLQTLTIEFIDLLTFKTNLNYSAT